MFYLERPDIRISMQIYFNGNDQLYFDGYDIGKTVEEAFGDSDYEYDYTIEPEEVNKLYQIFGLNPGDKSGLLQCIKNRFSVNEAYSLFGNFLTAHKILFKGFTWR